MKELLIPLNSINSFKANQTVVYLLKLQFSVKFEFLINRVFAAITFGGQALGRASALTPDIGRAKIAATKLFELFDRKPVPNSSDPDGLQPVRIFVYDSFFSHKFCGNYSIKCSNF